METKMAAPLFFFFVSIFFYSAPFMTPSTPKSSPVLFVVISFLFISFRSPVNSFFFFLIFMLCRFFFFQEIIFAIFGPLDAQVRH